MKKCQPRLLTPYLDGELSEDMRREIDQHLQSCAACGTLLEELSDATRQVRSMGRAVIPRAALAPALGVFIERAGLTPSNTAMLGTTEIARAGTAMETVEPAAAVLGAGGPQPAPEIEHEPRQGQQIVREPSEIPSVAEHQDEDHEVSGAADSPPGTVGIPDDQYWGQKSAGVDSPPGEPDSEVPASIAAQAPTWIEPQPWVPAPEPKEPAAPEGTEIAANTGADGPVEPGNATAGAGGLETAAATPVVEPELELSEAGGPLPATGTEAADALADQGETFEEHPSPPPPEIRPPWMEAPSSDDEDLEEAGRRAVDEAIGTGQTDADGQVGDGSGSAAADRPEDGIEEAQGPHRSWLATLLDRQHDEPATVPDDDQPAAGAKTPEEVAQAATTPAEGGTSEHEEALTASEEDAPAEQNVAAFRVGMASIADPTFDFGPPEPGPTGQIEPPAASGQTDDEPEPGDAVPGSPDDPGHVRGYREALVGARGEKPPPARGLGSLNTQLQIGLFVALAIVIVLTALLLMNQGPRPSSTASTSSQPRAAAHPSAAVTASRSATPSPAPSATSAAPATAALTEVVTAGAGGGGWRVAGIRTGSPNPATGITRVVFDLEGTGAQPNAQLGRGSDGAVYLTAAGITISPATLSGFNGRGAITGITQTGTDGLTLRLATNGSPGFSIGYLSVPNRLVLDFK